MADTKPENKKAAKQESKPPAPASGKGKSTEPAKDPAGKSTGTETGKDTDQSGKEESYLKDLMAISGYGGLFRFVSQGRNGIIVESIETGKRMQAFASMKVSALEDIAIYTEEEEIPFEEVVAAIHKYENGKETISPKSDPDELKDYFGAVLPSYDRDRVYVSDIKKILNWYNLLLKYDLMLVGGKKSTGKKAGKETEPASGKAEETNSGKSSEKSSGK
jgi:hypothetical protein